MLYDRMYKCDIVWSMTEHTIYKFNSLLKISMGQILMLKFYTWMLKLKIPILNMTIYIAYFKVVITKFKVIKCQV